MVLLERGTKLNRPVEVWLLDSENEISLLPKTTSIGSLILIPSDDGLIIKIKNNKGYWKEL